MFQTVLDYFNQHFDAIVVGVATSAVGTGFGAWVVFRLEAREGRRRELEQVVVASNHALTILRRYWIVLNKYRQADSDLRAHLPIDMGVGRLSQIDLSFLFAYGYPKLLTEIMDVEDQALATAVLIQHLQATPEGFHGGVPVNMREHRDAKRLVDEHLGRTLGSLDGHMGQLKRSLEARLPPSYRGRLIPLDDVGMEWEIREKRLKEQLDTFSTIEREPREGVPPTVELDEMDDFLK